MKYGIKSTKEIESVLLYGDKNKRKKKLISIVIPTYKREKLLKEALESAINQLNFNDYEIVIVDNDDNFGNFEIKKMIESYQKDNIYYYKNKKNLGVTGNWNRCIELANSEWIVMLHDDDWLKKDALEKIKSFILKYKEVKIINFKPDVYDGINNKYYESQGKLKVEKILYKR